MNNDRSISEESGVVGIGAEVQFQVHSLESLDSGNVGTSVITGGRSKLRDVAMLATQVTWLAGIWIDGVARWGIGAAERREMTTSGSTIS